jgi:hypothetical protein
MNCNRDMKNWNKWTWEQFIVLYDGSLLPMFEEHFCCVNGPVDKKCLYVEFLAKRI